MVPRYASIAAAIVTLVAALGCQTKPVADLKPQIRRIAVMPVQHLSGRDLEAIPAVLWEQADTVRLLTRLTESNAPMLELPFPDAQLPFDAQNVPAGSPMRKQLRFDGAAKQLVWREQMTVEERDELLGWSADLNWQYAVNELFAQSVGDRFNADESLRREVVAELRRLEFVVIDASESLAPPKPDESPDTSAYREKLRAVAMSTQANAVLTVAVDAWDWTFAFDQSEITISLTAVVSDPTDGKLLWQRSTGDVRCKLPAGLRYGSSLDLRQAYPQFVSQLVRLLLA